jgi:hypothetical protein
VTVELSVPPLRNAPTAASSSMLRLAFARRDEIVH